MGAVGGGGERYAGGSGEGWGLAAFLEVCRVSLLSFLSFSFVIFLFSLLLFLFVSFFFCFYCPLPCLSYYL